MALLEHAIPTYTRILQVRVGCCLGFPASFQVALATRHYRRILLKLRVKNKATRSGNTVD